MVDWLVGWLIGWLVDWLDGWLVGCLIGWLVGWCSQNTQKFKHLSFKRSSFSLYGTPLDPTIFDVSNETLGLFSTSKLSHDLNNPQNASKTLSDTEEIDLMDYGCSKNSAQQTGSATKMEKLLSSVYGILEVEPLDFACSSMSGGCKVDQYHGFSHSGINGGVDSLYYPSTSSTAAIAMPSATPMSAIQDHVQQLKVCRSVLLTREPMY